MVLLGLGGSVAIGAIINQPILPVFQEVSWQRPTTDDGWKEDVKNEQLNFRFDFQLEEMRANLSEKVLKHKADLDELVDCLDCFKYPLRQLKIDGVRQFTDQEIEEQYADQLTQRREEYERVSRSIERIEAEQRLRREGKVNRKEDQKKIQSSTDREREEMKKL